MPHIYRIATYADGTTETTAYYDVHPSRASEFITGMEAMDAEWNTLSPNAITVRYQTMATGSELDTVCRAIDSQ